MFPLPYRCRIDSRDGESSATDTRLYAIRILSRGMFIRKWTGNVELAVLSPAQIVRKECQVGDLPLGLATNRQPDDSLLREIRKEDPLAISGDRNAIGIPAYLDSGEGSPGPRALNPSTFDHPGSVAGSLSYGHLPECRHRATGPRCSTKSPAPLGRAHSHATTRGIASLET